MGPADAADPYRLLGIDHDATEADIRRAFRRLARGAHPDRGGDPARFVALRRAHDLLVDPVARADIDAAGRGSQGSGGETGGSSSTRGPTSPPPDADPAATARLRARWSRLEVCWRLAVTEVTPGSEGGFVALTGDDQRSGRAASSGSTGVLAVAPLDGSTLWWAGLATPPVPPPVVVDDLVIVATRDGVVHGLDVRTGTTRWECRLTISPTTVVPHGDLVIVAARDALTAVRAQGEVAWAVRPHGGVDDVVAAGPVVAVRTGAGAVVGLDPRSGSTRWWLRQAAPWDVTPVLAGGWLWLPERTAAGDTDQQLVGVDPATGAASHALRLPAPVHSVHAVNDLLVAVDHAGGLTAVRAGRPQWRMVVPAVPSAPVGIDGAVVVASADGVLRFLSARHGTEVHQVETAAVPGGPRTVVHSGNVVVVSGVDGGVVAHRVDQPAADTP